MKKILPIILLILMSTTILWGQKTFENKKFGFSMQEPKGWINITNEELKKSLETFDITEEKLEEMIKIGKGTILLTAYYKYEVGKYIGFNPKIQIDIRPETQKIFNNLKLP